MALTTVEEVLRVGGLDGVSDYTLFWLDSEAQLRERVTAELVIAEAYVGVVAPAAYAATDAGTRTLLGRAAVYVTLMQLCEPLKARKVYGSHYPLDSEDSPRFEALTTGEWESMADKMLNLFGAADSSKPIMLPGLVAGNEIEPLGRLTAEQKLREEIDSDRGLAVRQIGTSPV